MILKKKKNIQILLIMEDIKNNISEIKKIIDNIRGYL